MSFMSSKISKVRQSQGAPQKESDEFRVVTKRRLRAEAERANPALKRKRSGGDDDSDSGDPVEQYAKFMRKAKVDALALAAPELTGKEKLVEEARLARMQGMLPPVKQKIGRRQAFEQHEQFKKEAAAKREAAQEMGVYVKGPDERKRKDAAYEAHRRLFDFSGLANTVGSGERALRPTIGRSLSNGMLSISKRDIERVSNPAAFSARKAMREAMQPTRGRGGQRGGGGGRGRGRGRGRGGGGGGGGSGARGGKGGKRNKR